MRSPIDVADFYYDRKGGIVGLVVFEPPLDMIYRVRLTDAPVTK